MKEQDLISNEMTGLSSLRNQKQKGIVMSIGNDARFSTISFNQGEALLHLANMYPKLLQVIYELVQNALDKDVAATRIWIKVNYKTRHVAVRDNGLGASEKKFDSALSSVAERGRKGEGSLGEFGIGLISPLGKCNYFTFISCPSPHLYGFHEWTFNSEAIKNQSGKIQVPVRPRTDLTLDVNAQAGKVIIGWRSEMSLYGIVDDDYISNFSMDSLVSGIQDRFSTTMRRNKTVISIEITNKDGVTERKPNVTGLDFRGVPLEVVEMTGEKCGKTTFRLFNARKTSRGRDGKVFMGTSSSDFRFPFSYFARNASILSADVVTALSCGILEGEVISEKVSLHAKRMDFQENDAYIDLCVLLEGWYNDHGKAIIDEAKSSRRFHRFQDLGVQSIAVIEHLLKDPANAALLKVVDSFKVGSTGKGHVEMPERKIIGKDDQKSISTRGKPGVPRSPKGEAGEKPQRDRKDPVVEAEVPHCTVNGPKGTNRNLARGESTGLVFRYDDLDDRLWDLDMDRGILTFNITHKLFVKCDEKGDNALMRFQELVAMQALTLQVLPENLRTVQRQAFDEYTHSLVTWIMVGDRTRTSAKTKLKSKK